MKINTISMMYSIVVSAILFLAVITTVIGNDYAYAATGYYENKNPEYDESERTDYKGKTLTNDEYEKRLYHCVMMITEDIIPKQVKCESWVLSENGERFIVNYVIDKAMND